MEKAEAMKKKIKIEFHIDETTGKVEKVTDKNGNEPPGEGQGPANPTDKVSIEVAHNSPSCIWVFINGQWYQFC